MSWFSNFAEKAEDILNKMDQRAATVLSTTNEPRRSKYDQIDESSENYTIEPQPSYQYRQPPPPPSNQSHSGLPTGSNSTFHSRSSSLSSSFSTISSREVQSNTASSSSTGGSVKAPMRDESDKLFEFLNSKDLPPPTMVDSTASTSTLVKNRDSSEPDTEDDIEIIEKSDADSSLLNENWRETEKSTIKNDAKKMNEQIRSLTKEISVLTKRNVELETECKRRQKRVDNWQNQIANSDAALRQLREGQTDMKATLDAKDSQLAILRLRLEESDAQLASYKTSLSQLEAENQQLILQRQENDSQFGVDMNSLSEKIIKLESDLETEKTASRDREQESMAVIGRYQENQRQMGEEITNLQRQLSSERSFGRNLEKQLASVQSSLESIQEEFDEYKIKAQRTLQSKEDLIRTLQIESEIAHGDEFSKSSTLVLQAQCDSLRTENEDLRVKCDQLKSELDMVKFEKVANLNQRISELNDQIIEEQHVKSELNQELRQTQDELKYFRDDLTLTKNNLTTRIKDRDTEIEKLRKQLISKRTAAQGASVEELETRVKNLTENLIQKQTHVEQLSSERHSLALQLQRSEARLQETLDLMQASNNGQNIPGAVTIGMVHSSSASNLINRVRPLVEESPFDGQVTRRVKRAYGQIDAFSIRLGAFLRHYPSARAFVILYIVILHIWVMFVLFNYRPRLNDL